MSEPLVVACLRHADRRPDVDPLTGVVTRDARRAGPAPAELAALEYALRIGAAWSTRVLAVCAGPPAAEETLREALACGADVLRVPWPPDVDATATAAEPLGDPAGFLIDLAGDEQALARALAATIRAAGSPLLVLCGDRSADRGSGALPGFLAHELGAAQAGGLVDLHVEDVTGRTLLAERRLERGRRERLRLRPPAVCAVEGGGVEPRRAPLPAVIAATRAAVPTGPPPPAGPAGPAVTRARPYAPRTRTVAPPAGETARERLLALTGALTSHEPPTVIGPLDAGAAADALLAYLRRHGYLDAIVNDADGEGGGEGR